MELDTTGGLDCSLLEPMDIVVFGNSNKGELDHRHISIYAGTLNGEHYFLQKQAILEAGLIRAKSLNTLRYGFAHVHRINRLNIEVGRD